MTTTTLTARSGSGQPSTPAEYQRSLDAFALLADRIEARRSELASVLRRIESYETIEDEFFKSIDALRNAHLEVAHYGRRLHRGASFLPLNLPLYSMILFGVLPSAVVDRIAVRAPARLAGVVGELARILDLAEAFPAVEVSSATREAFVRDTASKADLVIFTGKLANVQKLRPKLRKDALLLFSGRGVNPIVVGPDADIQEAVEKTALVKLFNSGQDCAAPDSILVHASQSQRFIEELQETLGQVVIGSYENPRVRVGQLLEVEQLGLAAKQLSAHRSNIVFGGTVDFLDAVVHPTIVFYPKFQKTNATELFSPVFFITEYETEEQLEAYFSTPQYRENAMYVSLFGSSKTVESQDHTIVLKDCVINDVERGNLEYGGRSVGASFLQFKKNVRAQPLLISREVSAHIEWQEKLRACDGLGEEVEDTPDGFRVHKVCGPLPGQHLVVLAIDGPAGAYATHRLLHELHCRKTRIELGELTIVTRTPAARPLDPQAVEQAATRFGAGADHCVRLRGSKQATEPTAFAPVTDEAEHQQLLKNLGVPNLVFDGNLSRDAPITVEAGDDSDPGTSNIAYEAILNATRYMQIVGGSARPAPNLRVRTVEALAPALHARERSALPVSVHHAASRTSSSISSLRPAVRRRSDQFSLPPEFEAEFAEQVRSTFGDDLRFAFVFGSFAKGFGRPGHDIDTFVCVNKARPTPRQRFKDWLRDVHDRFGCLVDERYPTEIVPLTRLEAIAANISSFSLSLDKVNDADCFDVVTWVQIISDKKLFVTGSAGELGKFERVFSDTPRGWKESALEHLAEAGRHLADKPPLYFINNVYRFDESSTAGELTNVHTRQDRTVELPVQG